MFNGYADLGTWSGVTPYVGAGVGFAYNKLSGFTDTRLLPITATGDDRSERRLFRRRRQVELRLGR